jgi:hypothetical protein
MRTFEPYRGELPVKAKRVIVPMLLSLACTCALTAAPPTTPSVGGTNLPTPGYPEHKCAAPMNQPDRPFRNDEYSTRSYTSEVERYNRQVKEFRDCMADYVDKANNDIRRIQEAAQRALDDFQKLTPR